ncbi:hypothetical protein [Coleofasciculus sp. C1-SOL-03]|jgi:hypothetical protein|uniref:hypothetical protein n=1 Tax=Coleofasciculus sp. C1-SOL-03 TaxID=3069522 RepID=UPI0040640B54
MVQRSFQQESLPPALESGDRLNLYEFERRYNAMHSLKKAELIEGVVYLQQGEYVSLPVDEGNVIRSRVFPPIVVSRR